MEQEEGDKEEAEYKRKEVGESEQWQTQVIMPNPVKAICFCFKFFHTSFALYFLILVSREPRHFLAEEKK